MRKPFEIVLPDAMVRMMTRESYYAYRSYCRYVGRIVAARLEERKDDLAKLLMDTVTYGSGTFEVRA